MADLPINTKPIQESINDKDSLKVEVRASIDSQLRGADTISSQVLSKTANEIILSLPNQPSIKLGISNNDALSASLKIGDKVNLSFVKDASTVVITITPETTKPVIELEVPLSKSLQSALTKETSLPNQESVIKLHIEKNTSLPLGQARRLPQEQITLKVNDSTTIRASLPGINALPLNQTFQANLVLNNQQQLTVQFTKLPTEMPQSQIVIPVKILAAAIPPNILAALPINQVSNVSEIINQSTLLKNDSPTPSKIDMTKPINQLWLRHQNSPPLFTQLNNNVNKLLSVSNEQIRSEINIQQRATATQSVNNEQSVPLKPTVTNLSIENSAVIKSVDIPIQEKAQPIVKPLILPELASTKSNEMVSNLSPNTAFNKTLNNASVDIKPTPNATPNNPINDVQLTKTVDNLLPPKSDSNIKDLAALNIPKTTPAIPNLTSSPSLTAPLTAPLKNTEITAPAANSSNRLEQVTPTTPEITKNTTTSLPLQKLNELISALQLSSNQTQSPSKSGSTQPVEINLPSSVNLQATNSTPAADENLVAINQLKTLSKQITTQLPSMPQLTNPTQLSQLIEQFTRFEPLNTQNTATQSKSLGPLANALQLLLGGRSAAQGQSLSPQLLKHLSSLIKNSSSSTNNNNLNIALQMLGNLQSFKPLEESLTNLSSHIQFYQYQNAEQQQNNQSLFYFNMPTKEPNVPQVEGEVEEQNAQDGQSEKSWRLTLLLPCGENEKIKVNALLTGSKLELDLTCNNRSLVQRADFYLSFLSNRLESLGFDETSISCKEGEIPATLLKRPNQLVELMI